MVGTQDHDAVASGESFKLQYVRVKIREKVNL